jgi:hypothetical protein
MGWLTIFVEIAGGLAVLLGALVPLASIPMAAVLLVAIVTVHLPYGFSSIKLQAVTAAGAQFGPPGFETNLLYLACLAALVLGGSGPLAIEGLLAKRREAAHPSSHAGVVCRPSGSGGADGPEEGEDARAPMPAFSMGHDALETYNAEIAAAIHNFLDRTTRLSSGTRGSNHRPSLSITRSRPPHCPPGQAAFAPFLPADWLRSGDRGVNSQSRRIDGRSGPDDNRQLPSRLLQEKRT